ncbi:hypothetical protein BKA82DRAFT_4186992 [Pisolithus tinctorius]|nr:hypothetical protein BKA82DRAFT_4186992 [Pisolithus tinctorius]
MKLLDVKAVLDREKDIQKTDPNREILKDHDDKDILLCYTVDYEEMTGLMKMVEEERKQVRERYGYQKIIKSCEQAKKDGYEWLWVDTCCIDKRSSSELSEAINSMYRWYRNAQVCYAYLNDVDEEVFPVERDGKKFDKSNGWPEWFVRGWTLQELIAPKRVEFFNKDWVSIGNKRRLALVLEDITKIQTDVVMDGLAGRRLSVAQIMSWAADRKTTRVEDRAYSLMGLFGVNMPMLYGEGEKAFQRLQLEIIRTSSDHTIFAWDPFGNIQRTGSVLAEDPSDFRYCGRIKKVEPSEFVDKLMNYIGYYDLGNPWCIRRETHSTLTKIPTNPAHWCRLAWLRWCAQSFSQQLRTFTVSNAGIQVCLPAIPLSDSPSRFRALLACSDGSTLETIDLVLAGSSFDRTSRADGATALPEFKTLYLTYNLDANETHREFTLDDKHASYYGFTRCGTFPRKFPGDTVTLSSLTDDLIVIVYANDDVKSRFAVGLGYYLRRGWVHIVYDDQEADWTAFAENAHARMWKARAKHAQSMPERLDDPTSDYDDYFVKHAHLPRSIWGVKVAWGGWGTGDFKVMVDVEQCPGCCDGPCTWTTTRDYNQHKYKLDGWLTWLDECSGQQDCSKSCIHTHICLGDYGDYSNGNSNALAIYLRICGPMSMIPRAPFISPWSPAHNGKLVFPRQPKGLSLPTNECLVLLLKSLSTRAAGKHLVITVIHGNHPTEPQVLTLLYTTASPQVWQRKPFFEDRRKRFRSIREHFYSLMNMDQSRGPAAGHESVNRQKTDRAVKFFSDMFGLPCLRNYVGKITFFERLPWMMKTDPRNEDSVGNLEGWPVTPCIFACKLTLLLVLPLLGERCRTLRAERDAPHWNADERQKVAREMESISQTLGLGLLKYIGLTFKDTWADVRWKASCAHFNTPSVVQEVETLQAKLSTTEDEDERRALEEDVTGKARTASTCLLSTLMVHLLIDLVALLQGLDEIYETMASLTDPGDDQAHLQRIMFDAGAGTSKHQLLLDARAAEQVKWSGITTARDTTNTDTQGPSTSSETPSTSLV